jgi:hypothetical protein
MEGVRRFFQQTETSNKMKYSALIPAIVLAPPAIMFAGEIHTAHSGAGGVAVYTAPDGKYIGFIADGERYEVLRSIKDSHGKEWDYVRALSGHLHEQNGARSEGWIGVRASDEECFLTTACIRARGLADDCWELTILRKFRDLYVASSDEGKCAIAEYYSFAPTIVQAINRCGRAELVYAEIYENLVAPSVNLILARRFQEALDHYKRVALELRKGWLNA